MSTSPSIDHVAAGLRSWARREVGDDVELVAGPDPVSGGFDTFTYRFELSTGGPLILRLYPSASRGSSAEREATILAFLDRVGYPAPRPRGWSAGTEDLGAPFVVMERVEGGTVLDALKVRPTRAGELFDSLAAAHATLHALDSSGWPLAAPSPGTSEIDRRLGAVEAAQPPTDPALGRALRWLQEHRAVARHEEPAVCHNDFHPLNAMVDPDGRLAIIDWEGAGIGDRHSDLARSLILFEWAPVIASSRVERVVLRAAKPWVVKRYRLAYERHLPVEEERLHYWMAFHAAESWWEAATLLDGTFARDTRTDLRAGPAAVVAPAMARLFARLVADG